MVLCQFVLLPYHGVSVPPLFASVNHNFVGKRVKISLLHVTGMKTEALVFPVIPLCLDFITVTPYDDVGGQSATFSSSSPFRPDVSPSLINYTGGIQIDGPILSAPGNGRIFLPNYTNDGQIFTYSPPVPPSFTGMLTSPVLTVALSFGILPPGHFPSEALADISEWNNLIVTYDITEI